MSDTSEKIKVPQNSKELYDMMLDTPDLCGKFELTDNHETIKWHLYENIKIVIGVDPSDCWVGIEKPLFRKIENEIFHWHPTADEIYDVVCKIGKRGGVLVLRTTAFGGTVLYGGSKADCPYPPDKKYLFGQYYYLEAK